MYHKSIPTKYFMELKLGKCSTVKLPPFTVLTDLTHTIVNKYVATTDVLINLIGRGVKLPYNIMAKFCRENFHVPCAIFVTIQVFVIVQQ